MNSETQYISLYRQCAPQIKAHSADILNAPRDAAFEDFCRLGFPSKKVERYRYTDIDALFAPDYGLNINRLAIPVNPYDAFRCDIPNLSTQLYFIVNDQFYSAATPAAKQGAAAKQEPAAKQGAAAPEAAPAAPVLCSDSGSPSPIASPNPSLPEGVIVASLARMAQERPDLVAQYYGKLAPTSDDAITALNTMLAQDGLLIYIPRACVLDKAIQIVNILRSDVPLMVNRRVLIIVEEGASAKLLFCDHAADDREFLATEVIEAYVGDNAALELYSLEETHVKNVRISNTYIRQERSSRVNHDIITLHNGTTRNTLDLRFAGEGAECSLGGCVIADKSQHIDNNTQIIHAVPHCTSTETYKYVLDEQSTGAFAGLVKVEQGAQQTSSNMTNQNLCATKEARMYTQPQLEIYADDVKCSHGSTVGQLNDKALFYMQQRGIPLREARLLLQNAFVGEVIDHIALAPLRDRLHYLVEKRFRGELNKCEGCKLCK